MPRTTASKPSSPAKTTSTCELTFTSLLDGERLLSFGLLPTLRVTRVAFDNAEIGFIQEKKDEDSSFHVLFPTPLVKGRRYKITIEYHGTKVLEDAGGGNFAVRARTSWYPSVNAFNDRATFDLTFKIPTSSSLSGSENWSRKGRKATSPSRTGSPIFLWPWRGSITACSRKKEIADPQTKYQIEGYATSELPSYMRGAESIGGMSPARLTETAMVDAQNSIRISITGLARRRTGALPSPSSRNSISASHKRLWSICRSSHSSIRHSVGRCSACKED
ncbi:MAG: hypothetical protein IPJ07_01840 [Acidobacteria bacterium]|nr:hypothetical protein [Acidobacteriota bacterium]